MGKTTFMMQSSINIDNNEQSIRMQGNVDGQQVSVNLTDTRLQVEVSASCVNPFEINTELAIEPNTNLAQVFDVQPGVNVDPAKLTGCVGDALQAAYKKIANEYQHLGGYSAQEYFFSNERVDELQRSVLILITPRAPALISKESKDNQASVEQAMKGLQERFGFSYTLPPNIEAALTQLQHNNYYREFRKGDVSMERWDRMRTTGDRLKEALSFLYY